MKKQAKCFKQILKQNKNLKTNLKKPQNQNKNLDEEIY